LAVAVCLSEAGFAVQVHTAVPASETTSAASGAIWRPQQIAERRATRWSEVTLPTLTGPVAEHTTGVRLAHGLEASRRRTAPPAWMTALPGFRPAEPEELPPGYVSGWWYSAPVVEMPAYLSYLPTRLRRAGGTIKLGRITSLREAAAL